jgi:hypothetical protein
VSDYAWDTETQSIELAYNELISLLAALMIAHNGETDYSTDGWLRDHNLIARLIAMLRSYSCSGTGDGLPR